MNSAMAYLIGTDEAGYGPNLGPLIISATLWEVADPLRDADLYEVLGETVTTSPTSREDERLVIADSKTVYKPGGGLAALESGVLAALRATGKSVSTWRDAWRTLAPASEMGLDEIPWYAQYDAPLPCHADDCRIEQLGRKFAAGLRKSGVWFCCLRCLAVFPARFNDLVDQRGSKAGVLSHETLRLVEQMLATIGDAPVLIQCDKHGSRNRYGPILQTTFPENLVEVVRESRAESIYRWGPPRRRVEIRFVAKGERFLPSALASMAAKYLRELAMQALNEFWREHVPGLKPTAGYPADARRFKAEIAAAQAELAMDDRVLWRRK